MFNHKFRVLHNALSSAPSEPLLYIELSNLYLNDHQLKKAEDVLISGLKKNDLKKNPFLLMQIGYIYRQTKKIELLKKVLQKLFTIFSEKGRYDLAEQVKLELNSL